MSAEEDDGPGQREVAYRLFAAEFEDADFSYAESDEERAPNYVVTPTGARVNRLFAVGVLTEIEPVGEDVLRARIVDPTGAFVVYAGQYQPDAKTFLERATPPAFVAVTGKARTFQPEDSDVVYTSIRPESVNEVDAETRDRWTVRTAERTLDRIGVAAAALESDARGDELAERLRAAGVDESLAAGLPLAIDRYGTTGAYLTALRDLSLDAARVVADERDEVESLTLGPGDGGEGEAAALAALALDDGIDDVTEEAISASADATAADTRAGSAGSESGTGSETGSVSATETPTAEEEPSAVESAEETTSGEAGDASAAGVEGTESSTTEKVDSEGEQPSEPAGSEPTAGTSEPTDTGTESVDDEIGDFEPGEFELDDEVREEVESEYGTEFQSGTEVDEPGEADIETPEVDAEPADVDSTEPDTTAEEVDSAETGTETATESPPESDTAPETTAEDAATATTTEDTDTATETTTEDTDTATETASEDEAAEPDVDQAEPAEEEDVDLEDAVMDAMETLDEGDGADRQAVIDHVTERTGADEASVEDAIQSALMDGRCYEPDDATLKPI